MQRDSFAQTLKVATVLCVVCSVIVAGAAVGLSGLQQANKALDQKKNVLIAAGLFDKEVNKNSEVEEIYEENVERVLIDLETGEPVDSDTIDPEKYDQRKAAKNPDLNKPIEPSDALGGIKKREKFAFVYRVKNKETGEVDKVVLPVYGKGLWSTLYGFLAVGIDGNTISGITFYEHAETPGLGGEIESEKFKEEWPGKTLFDEDGEVAIALVKAGVQKSEDHGIDALSGATITSNGVEEMVHYWAGADGFGPYLDRLRKNGETGDTGG